MPFSSDDGSGSLGALSESEALRQMYRITSDTDRPFEEKLRALLEMGQSLLGVEVGFMTEISDGTQLIVAATGDHELLQPGKSCPLSKSYCRRTIEYDNALTVQHAGVEGWEADAAYEEFGLESYIGAKIIVDGDVYGTFCFADTEPRDRPFTTTEETFVELMAEWASYELFQQQSIERIQQQRDRLEAFASVVTHDLRNPLNVAEGRLELAREEADSDHLDAVADAHGRMNDLIDDLLTLAREGTELKERERVELPALVSECWESVATAEATLVTETDRVVQADPSRLRQLFENLFRNSVEHGGDDVTVTVGDHEGGFYVEDDGPGIPAAERDDVFEMGHSTRNDGTGFGLAIAARVAEAHGWEVEAVEGSTGGARFEISGVESEPESGS